MYQMFNVDKFYSDLMTKGIARVFNLLIEALNEKRLPKYILILQDKDLITNMKTSRIEVGYVMGAIIYYIIKQIDLLVDRHKTDILDKKPGACCDEHPKIVWVRMLKWPKQEFSVEVHRAISLRGKFNSILEERLLNAKGSHHIMSILVDMKEFDMWGDLTTNGKYDFWREVDRAMKKFDLNEITLNPRKNQNVVNKSQLPELPPKINIMVERSPRRDSQDRLHSTSRVNPSSRTSQRDSPARSQTGPSQSFLNKMRFIYYKHNKRENRRTPPRIHSSPRHSSQRHHRY